MALLLVSTVAYSQKMISSSKGAKMAGKPAMMAVICNPGDFNITVNQGYDNQGCYYDSGFSPIWSYTPGTLCNVNQLPHGMYIEFTGATIISTSTTNPCLSSAPRTLGSNFVYWNKEPLGTCASPTNAIPSNPLISVRIRVNQISNTVSVTLRNLISPSCSFNYVKDLSTEKKKE